MTSPPAVYKNLVICGSLVPDGEPRGPLGRCARVSMRARAKLVWTFHTVAQAGEFGNDTWAARLVAGSRRRQRVAAPQRGCQSAALCSCRSPRPPPITYGGDRKGAGLFGDSLVALDASTGKRLWHFQTVHHNLWDYDLPAQPALVQVRQDGKLIDAVAQVTKTGFTFVFDRVTGEPLFPIEEVAGAEERSAGRSRPGPRSRTR